MRVSCARALRSRARRRAEEQRARRPTSRARAATHSASRLPQRHGGAVAWTRRAQRVRGLAHANLASRRAEEETTTTEKKKKKKKKKKRVSLEKGLTPT